MIYNLFYKFYIYDMLNKCKKKKSLATSYLCITIVGVIELNFCVRDGNRCTLNAIITKKIFN